MFYLEKHLKFLKEVEENPDLYATDFTQYFPPNGVGLWINWDRVYPECGSSNGLYKIIGHRYDMGWNECKDCGWKGDLYDVITKNETNRINR